MPADLGKGHDVATYGGIELGGTKCVCAVGDGSDDAWAETVIPTTDPETTTKSAIDWFRDVQRRSGSLVSMGVASFGPLDRETGAIAQATPKTAWRGWAELSEGCYLLRSNVSDWTADELWRAYIQLTEAEGAFRIQKSDLSLRPIWHQRQDRVAAHIFVCFLTYVLWKTLALKCERAGLGSDPRKVFEEIRQLCVVDVALPTRKGVVLKKRCVTRPSDHQAILLQRLGLRLPSTLPTKQM